jgi:hypothetical protein
MDDVVAKLRARMGRLTTAAVIDMAHKTRLVDDFESEARKFTPESGFVIFDEIDRRDDDTPRPDGRAPVELLFNESPDGGYAVTYVVPSSLIAIDDNASLLAAAKRPDDKLKSPQGLRARLSRRVKAPSLWADLYARARVHLAF